MLTGTFIKPSEVTRIVSLIGSTIPSSVPGVIKYLIDNDLNVKAKYPSGIRSDSAFITSVYTSALGRIPDAPGLAYWLNQGKSMAPEVLLTNMLSAVRKWGMKYPSVEAAAANFTFDIVEDGYVSQSLLINRIRCATYLYTIGDPVDTVVKPLDDVGYVSKITQAVSQQSTYVPGTLSKVGSTPTDVPSDVRFGSALVNKVMNDPKILIACAIGLFLILK